jgi:ADP-ribosylglycohydrolase
MKQQDLAYPDFPDLWEDSLQPPRGEWYRDLFDALVRYSRLASELGYPEESSRILAELRERMGRSIEVYRDLVRHPKPDPSEPDDLVSIRAARPQAQHRLSTGLPHDFPERWHGSFLGRGAGCTLGAALEFRSVEEMEKWARYFGDGYPPTDYWQRVKNPFSPRYVVGRSEELTRGGMDCIPADDDTGYSLIGLLTLEENGQDFTHEQMARTWKRHIPLRSANGSWGCFWGERNFLQNLHEGVPVDEAGFLNNPNVQSVAAWTRADTWGYVAPGWPEKAAELAHRDASINHHRNGVYGAMFFAAAISAAFVLDDPVEALHAGLNEIPSGSLFSEAVRWCLHIAPEIRSFRDGAAAVRQRYSGMFQGHAINNACFTVLGIAMGRTDFSRVIGETVAMGMDNDCTGATAGSIVGAVIGKNRVPVHWYEKFNNRMHSFFNDCPAYIDLDDLCRRYEKQAKEVIGSEAR